VNAPLYVGGRSSIVEALRHAGQVLREIGDDDIAVDVEAAAERVAERAREEDTREFPILPPKEGDTKR